jgi:hypothetical protein
MNKKGQLTIGGIVIMIMAIFAGLALISGIFSQQQVMTDKAVITDESIDISGAYNAGAVNITYPLTVADAPTGWQLVDCPLSSVVLSNSSGEVFTSTTDYVFNTTDGTFTLKNTALVNQTFLSDNITYVDYNYCRDGYNKDSGSRGVARMIGLFTVLALMVFVAAHGLKDWLGK